MPYLNRPIYFSTIPYDFQSHCCFSLPWHDAIQIYCQLGRTRIFIFFDCCVHMFFLLLPNTPTCSFSPPLWSTSTLLCFLTLTWYYPHIRPTRVQIKCSIFDCCVNTFFAVFFLIKTHPHVPLHLLYDPHHCCCVSLAFHDAIHI